VPTAAPETTSAAQLAIAGTATGVLSEVEAASELDKAPSDSDTVTDETESLARRTRARRVSSFRYMTGKLDRDDDKDGKPKPRLIGVYTLRSRH